LLEPMSAKQALRLEWYIVVLIFVEILLTVFQSAISGLTSL
jgi:uncharacterized Rmd1/YagE family protein